MLMFPLTGGWGSFARVCLSVHAFNGIQGSQITEDSEVIEEAGVQLSGYATS